MFHIIKFYGRLLIFDNITIRRQIDTISGSICQPRIDNISFRGRNFKAACILCPFCIRNFFQFCPYHSFCIQTGFEIIGSLHRGIVLCFNSYLLFMIAEKAECNFFKQTAPLILFDFYRACRLGFIYNKCIKIPAILAVFCFLRKTANHTGKIHVIGSPCIRSVFFECHIYYFRIFFIILKSHIFAKDNILTVLLNLEIFCQLFKVGDCIRFILNLNRNCSFFIVIVSVFFGVIIITDNCFDFRLDRIDTKWFTFCRNFASIWIRKLNMHHNIFLIIFFTFYSDFICFSKIQNTAFRGFLCLYPVVTGKAGKIFGILYL